MAELILVRHPPVTQAWQKTCYARSDPGLSRAGQALIAPLVEQLAALRPDHILHSDMRRSRAVALPLAARLGLVPMAAPQWQERDFGTWEGQSWQSIYRATGNAMDGMIDDPECFRPGGGETTGELVERVRQALDRLPKCGLCMVVAHGGPIAAARCLVDAAAPAKLADYFIAPGDYVRIGLRAYL
ncbi:MAG: histidine phosphatase family protein [Novosphingobium sp.]